MTRIVNVLGGPGCGKTSVLVDKYIAAAQATGDTRQVAVVTYTRAAALEIKARIALRLGLPADTQVQNQLLPWIGTIHALCYRLLGRPAILGRSDIDKFMRGDNAGASLDSTSPEHADIRFWDPVDDPSLDEKDVAVRVLSTARHRQDFLINVIPTLPSWIFERTTADRLRAIANEYRAWKKDQKGMDYEDLLDAGREIPLPVRVLIADECQDNSRLLWSVLDTWMARAELGIFAGDPWQALYRYSGASPQEFRSHRGDWVTLPVSHRLTQNAAAYAQRVLHIGGWQDDLIDTWAGSGLGGDTDGSEMILARTHSILDRFVEPELRDLGTPYAKLGRGKAPLEQAYARVYGLLWTLDQGCALVSADDLWEAISDLPKTSKQPGYNTTWTKERRLIFAGLADTPETYVDAATVDRIERGGLRVLLHTLPWARYYQTVIQRHGLAALTQTPKLRLGTIHSAKGREADAVQVVESWGTIPGFSLSEKETAKDEACVAYVAVSRHRKRLKFISLLGGGIPYPFPGGAA